MGQGRFDDRGNIGDDPFSVSHSRIRDTVHDHPGKSFRIKMAQKFFEISWHRQIHLLFQLIDQRRDDLMKIIIEKAS